MGVIDTSSAIVLSSWAEAIASCESPRWQDFYLEAANRYRDRLVGLSPQRFSQWNDLVREVKKVSVPLVQGKIESLMQKEKLPKVFSDCVQWDVLHTCMEAEYADVFPPGYFASQAYWYMKGHFPCGWEGNFPEGKLVIY